jgi:hypothetical protein
MQQQHQIMQIDHIAAVGAPGQVEDGVQEMYQKQSKQLPCNGCRLREFCRVNFTDCSDFRAYVSNKKK